MNRAYKNFWELEDRFFLATGGNLGGMWDSLINRSRFELSVNALRDLANAGEVTEESLRSLYATNTNAQRFIRYLQDLGVFSWDCAEAIAGLVVQVNELWESQLFRVSRLEHLDIIDETTARFDALARALEDIERVGVVSATRLRDVLETFPELSGYFTATSQGFRLSDEFSDMSILDILSSHATSSLQEYVDRLEKTKRQLIDVQALQDGSARQKEELERATQAVTNAQDNLNVAMEVWAVHLRAQAIRERTDALNEQREVLNKQLSAYRELIDIRRDLLRTYRREIEYQKELARRQRTVVDLQTQLRLARMDTSAAGRARVREIESQLQTAQEDLDAFTLERAIDVLTAHLDSEFQEYQQLIQSQVDRIIEEIAGLADSLQVTVNIPPANNTNIERALLQGQLSQSNTQINSQQQSVDAENHQREVLEQALRNAENMSSSGWSKNFFRGGWWGQDSTAANKRKAAIKTASTALNAFNDSAAEQARLDQLRQERDGVVKNLHNTGMTKAELAALGISVDDLRRLGIYHSGGFVGGLKTNEEFAKLLKGEFVVTPNQMDNFMSDTLPNIATPNIRVWLHRTHRNNNNR